MFPWRQAPLAAASRGQKGIALNRFFRCSQTPSLSAIYKQIIADRIITPFLYLFFSSHNDILPLLFFPFVPRRRRCRRRYSRHRRRCRRRRRHLGNL